MFNRQKRYFEQKLDGIQKMIWDLEFKRFKTLYVREQIRREYDHLRSRLEILKTQIASEKDKPSLNKDEFKRLEDDQILFERDIDRKQEQMKQLDIEVNGAKPSPELPEGHQGVNQTLDSLRELQIVTRDYARNL